MAESKRGRTGLMSVLFVLAVLFLVGFQLLNIRQKLNQAESEQAAMAARVAEQRQENASLEAALARGEDPEYLSALARDRLGMVSPGQKDFYDVSN